MGEYRLSAKTSPTAIAASTDPTAQGFRYIGETLGKRVFRFGESVVFHGCSLWLPFLNPVLMPGYPMLRGVMPVLHRMHPRMASRIGRSVMGAAGPTTSAREAVAHAQPGPRPVPLVTARSLPNYAV